MKVFLTAVLGFAVVSGMVTGCAAQNNLTSVQNNTREKPTNNSTQTHKYPNLHSATAIINGCGERDGFRNGIVRYRHKTAHADYSRGGFWLMPRAHCGLDIQDATGKVVYHLKTITPTRTVPGLHLPVSNTYITLT